MACSFCRSEKHDKRTCESPRALLAALDEDEARFRSRYAMTPDVATVYARRRQELQAQIAPNRTA